MHRLSRKEKRCHQNPGPSGNIWERERGREKERERERERERRIFSAVLYRYETDMTVWTKAKREWGVKKPCNEFVSLTQCNYGD